MSVKALHSNSAGWAKAETTGTPAIMNNTCAGPNNLLICKYPHYSGQIINKEKRHTTVFNLKKPNKTNMQNIIRLSVAEAGKLFGVEQKTIRRAIKNQEIRYIVVRGRYKINFDSLLKWSQKKPLIRKKTNQHGLGQYVSKWKINNKLYSPNPKIIE